MKKIFLALSLVLTGKAVTAGVLDDFGSLGDSSKIIERAKKLYPEKNISLVQNRVVNRVKRSEFLLGYGNVTGGDPYVNTQNVGVGYEWHMNYHWSFGARYSQSYNELSKEGQMLINEENLVPAIDHQKSNMYATVTWYPIYGKMNLYDLGVTHFDIFLTGGVGSVELKSGSSSAFTLGGGFGFWVSQHLSARLELRHENFSVLNGSAQREISVLGLSMGYLL